MNQALGCPPRQRSAAWQITQQPAHFDATCGHGDAGNVQRATRWLLEFLFSRIPNSIKHHKTSFLQAQPNRNPNKNRSGFVCPSFSPMGCLPLGRASRFGRAAMSWASTRSSGPPRPMASQFGDLPVTKTMVINSGDAWWLMNGD